ncbi:glycerophosphodiester phosphodiesterase [Microbacterium sp. A82]
MTLLIVGHRGAMVHLPENSLASYALAEEIGVDEIELDVRLSRDEQLFLLHDATLDRTAGDDSARGLGPASQLTLAQLQAVTLDSGRGVVTLTEMYDATRTFIQLEIKDSAAVPYLAKFFEERPADAARTALASFSADVVGHAAELMPHIGRQIILTELAKAEEFDGGLRALLNHTKATRLACGFEGLTPELVAELQARDIEVHVWPMRTIEQMREVIRLGADGTTSDDPAQALAWRDQVLAENGVAR